MPVSTDRLGILTDEQLQSALDRFDLGKLVSAEAATTGNFGQNVFLQTTTGRYVLRGNPLIEGQFAKEQFFARIFDERTTLTVPWPYRHESDTALFGWEYAIMPCLEGIQIADDAIYEALTDQDRKGIARALGRTAAQIQQATWETPGHWDATQKAIVPFQPSWSGWIEETIRDLLNRSLMVTEDEKMRIAQLLEAARPALAEPFTPVLLHGDFSRNNVVAEPMDDGWQITGVYDLMSAHFGHPEMNLTRQFCAYIEQDPALADAFLQSWQQATGQGIVDRDQFKVFVLLERLMIWEWAKRTEFSWWPAEMPLREWLERYFRHIPA